MSASSCVVGVQETLNALSWTTQFQATSQALFLRDDLVHRRDCPSLKGLVLSNATVPHLDLGLLRTLDSAPCCLATVEQLPGKVKNRLGRAVLRNAHLLLTAHRGLGEAPEPLDLDAAVLVLAAEASWVDARRTVDRESDLYPTDPLLLELLARLRDAATASKAAAARLLLSKEEESLLRRVQGLIPSIPGLEEYPSRDAELSVAAWVYYGDPLRLLSSLEGTLSRALFLHYVAEGDTVLVVPAPLWKLWRNAYTEFSTESSVFFDPSQVDSAVLKCMVADVAADGNYMSSGRLRHALELASVLV